MGKEKMELDLGEEETVRQWTLRDLKPRKEHSMEGGASLKFH